MNFAFALLMAMAPGAASPGDSTSVAGCLPASDPGGLWVQVETVRVYHHKALYELIDGGATLFEEYGFTAVATATYESKGRGELSAEVYQMTDHGAALGMFSSLASGARDPGPDPGIIRYSGEYYICLCRGPFLVTITARDPSDWDTLTAKRLLAAIIPRLQGPSDVPVVVSVLESAGHTAIVYLRGPLGLQNHAPPWFTQAVVAREVGIGRQGSTTTIVAKLPAEMPAGIMAERLAAATAGQPIVLGREHRWIIAAHGGTVDSCTLAVEKLTSLIRASKLEE